jgi:hypothetical protein
VKNTSALPVYQFISGSAFLVSQPGATLSIIWSELNCNTFDIVTSWTMDKNTTKEESVKHTLAEVKKEMAAPRIAMSARPGIASLRKWGGCVPLHAVALRTDNVIEPKPNPKAAEIAALQYANVLYWREGIVHSLEAKAEYQHRQDRLQRIRAIEPVQDTATANHNFPSIPNSSEWEQLYQAAIQERDWSKMQERIQAANLAIRYRLYEFSHDHRSTPEENQAIADAVNRLAILRKEVITLQGVQRAG